MSMMSLIATVTPFKDPDDDDDDDDDDPSTLRCSMKAEQLPSETEDEEDEAASFDILEGDVLRAKDIWCERALVRDAVPRKGIVFL